MSHVTRYIIGIDPGVQTGFACYDRAAHKLCFVTTTDFWGVFEQIKEFKVEDTRIVVEVAHNAPVFWQQKARGQNDNHLSRMAQNVGQVMREARLMAEGLRRRGYQVVEVKPLGKKKAEDFKRLTKWPERTNQHERDAAVLCFGM